MSHGALASLTVLRLLVSLLPLDLSQFSHQLSTPLTSHTLLKEGVFLFKNGINPYSGGLFRHSPITLSLFSTILPLASGAPLLWAAADAFGAWTLIQIWRSRSKVIDARKERMIAAFYLLNPYTALATQALSTSTFDNTLYLLSVLFACRRQVAPSLLCLALLTTSSLTSSLLLPPIIMLHLAGPTSGLKYPKPFTASRRAWPLVLEYFAYVGILALISTLVAGDWSWVERTWGATLLLPDVTPNPGLWWYFFTEMFDHFRPFFLMVFSAHVAIYVVPICLKFQHDPLFAIFLLQGVFATFKSYPSLADPGLFISTVSLFPEIFPYLRHPLVTIMLHLYSSSLLFLFHDLWLVQGTGNANFYYASTMVFGLANGFALTDCMWAGLRIAFGPLPDGWEISQA